MIVYEAKAINKQTGAVMYQGEVVGAKGIKDIAKMYMNSCEMCFRVKEDAKK